MSAEVEGTLRGPEAYALARRALQEMEDCGVWPTPLNFELWLHYVGDPEGPLGREIQRIMRDGESFTEQLSEALATNYLPRARLTDEIRDAGAQLSRELKSVAAAMSTAQRSQRDYGKTLADAGEGLESGAIDADGLKRLVDNLTSATEKVQTVNDTLEKRLQASTREVVKLREHLEQVRRDAMTDALTNLANRKALDEHLTRACLEADENGQPVTLAVIDIDHFKRFNDTWGHQTGDQVLRYVASVMGRLGLPPRLAARYGGEEFAIVFPGETSPIVEAAMNTIREEIASRILKRRSTNEELGAVTISVGIAQRVKGEGMASLMERADEALYASKRSGRNKVTNAGQLDQAAA
ncbi:MAG: GGDEF domain-containing protein [Proteobacteria bacterium]|nr:GGDEF domain-containing protein [Pseudomonadota bacterium]